MTTPADRSPGKPLKPMRQHWPKPRSYKGTSWPATGAPWNPCLLHMRGPGGARNRPTLYPPHSPLITSATRRVPVPSRLMTPKHLEGGAEGRTGQPRDNQPPGEEVPRPHPRGFKNIKFKGPCPGREHSDSSGPRTPRPTRTSQPRKFKTSQTAPNGAVREWGAGATPSRPGCASPRLRNSGNAGRSSAAPGPPAPTLHAHSRDMQQAGRRRAIRPGGKKAAPKSQERTSQKSETR